MFDIVKSRTANTFDVYNMSNDDIVYIQISHSVVWYGMVWYGVIITEQSGRSEQEEYSGVLCDE